MNHTDLIKMLEIQFIDCLPETNSFKGGYDVLQSQFGQYLALPQSASSILELKYLLNDIKNSTDDKPLIIHLFCHSDQTGIWFDENKPELIMQWQEFVALIDQINTNRNNELTVVITGCESFNSITCKNTVKEFIGYKNTVKASVAHYINQTIYSLYVSLKCPLEDSVDFIHTYYPNLRIMKNGLSITN